MTCAVAHYKPRLPGAEWMADCILHWSEDFQSSQRWDKLGQHKGTDILSGPRAAIVILGLCQSVRSITVKWKESVWGALAVKMPLDTSLSGKENRPCLSRVTVLWSIADTVNSTEKISDIKIDHLAVTLMSLVNVVKYLACNWWITAVNLLLDFV